MSLVCTRQRRTYQNGILDRFIPPRSLQSSGSRVPSSTDDGDGSDGTSQNILDKHLRSDRRRLWRQLLSDALFGVRVQPLGRARAVERHDWDVRPRRDPLVGAPELSVWLPELSKASTSLVTTKQLMSWGACGVLAVAGRRDVYLWRRAAESATPGAAMGTPGTTTPGTAGATELLTQFDVHHRPMSLCWGPFKNLSVLAIGTGHGGVVQMWDCEQKKEMFSRRLPGNAGAVIAISWHPHEDLIAMGASSGIVYLTTMALVVIKSVRVFEVGGGGVAALSFSPDGVLLACGGAAGAALVWDWETGVVRGDEVDYKSTITGLSWHPWRSSLVAVGTLAGDIALLNFSTRRTTTASYSGSSNRPVSVTAMSFSPRTAELVVAFAGRGVSQVAVLSDLTTVVDRLKSHTDSVNYMCWSPDGAILATAGADEMLCMWNFLGAKATQHLRRRALQEAREDRSGIRRQFRCVIR